MNVFSAAQKSETRIIRLVDRFVFFRTHELCLRYLFIWKVPINKLFFVKCFPYEFSLFFLRGHQRTASEVINTFVKQ